MAAMRETTTQSLRAAGRPPAALLLYRDPCLARATELIEAGQRRPVDILNSVNTRWLAFTELQDLDKAEKFFVNINTPQTIMRRRGKEISFSTDSV